MKTKKYHVLAIALLFLGSCAISRNTPIIKGEESEAIEIAINDFLKKCNLRKDDKVFSVTVYNENPDYLGIIIFGVSWEKLFATPKIKIGEKTTFPSRYIEKKGKLFYWDDSTKVLTKEMIDALARYKHIDSTYHKTGFYEGEMEAYSCDETKKGIDYYFCRNNFAIFKKKITRIAMGWYLAPTLNCNEKK